MIREITGSQIESKATRFIDSAFGTPAPDHVYFVEVAPMASYEKIHPTRCFSAEQLRKASDLRVYLPDTALEIVVVGDAPDREALWETARWLEQKGYGNMYVYEGSREDWQRLGTGTHCSEVDADGLIVGPALTRFEKGETGTVQRPRKSV